ncbi:DUF917 domain-containing protein [Pseudonocardia sp. S2-4]|uniref:DUF917 domain-containing protein n=1 Tax=Pseudonocardia humida TaxID=2800819 RepID=A0ABT0ZWL4_9PSEU|nr:DUF917 domain-containing protein [Pseudonocardia humida]
MRADDVDALVVGLSLLGSGGGGDAGVFATTLRRALGEGSIVLHPPAELGEASVVAVGMLGGTRMLTERLPSGQEIVGAVRALARWTGAEPEAVMALEAAGVNGVLAVAAAAELRLPLVDADLMGRALPRADQTTRAVAGGSLAPFAMAESGGRTVLLDRIDPVTLERVARAFIAQSGGWAGCAFAPTPASVVCEDACLGSLARALDLGRAHADAPPARIAEALGGRALGAGRAVEIARNASATFGRAGITVLDDTGPVLRLEAENEYLLALLDGEPVASCPDLLCVLDRRTGAPIAVDALRVGDDVTVVVLPGPRWWRERPERLVHVGPRAFGLDCDPVLM